MINEPTKKVRLVAVKKTKKPAKKPAKTGKRPIEILRATARVPSKLGRPQTPFDPDRAEDILDAIATGESLAQYEERTGFSRHQVYKWLARNRDFHNSYLRARNAQMDVFAEDLTALAASATPENHTVIRLQIETQKWLMSKLAATRYGDKVTTELTGPGGGPIQIAQQVLDVTALSDEAREALREGLRIAVAAKRD